MEFRSQEDGVGMPVSVAFSPPIRVSAFSKPLLPPSSSLLSSRGGTRNGIGLASSTTSDVFDPTATTTTTIDHPLRSHVIDPDPAPTAISSPSAATSGDGGGAGGLSSAAAATLTASSVTTNSSSPSAEIAATYRECLRNHAARHGGHVLDGCGEFTPGGDADTPDALKCAACGCHRSFHRKETEGDYNRFNGSSHHHAGRGRMPLLLPPPPLHHPQPQHHQQYHLQTQSASGVVPWSSAAVAFGGNYSWSGGATTESSSEEHPGAPPRAPPGVASKKRFRTKFTAEQKEKMLGFAERVGWRFQKQDEALVEHFCAEVGVRRKVLKVWMHNNKHLIRKQQQPQQQQDQQQQDQQQ